MRAHQLRLRAIGPFADEQTIDFDRLGAGGLFLLEGPTGVGKSTVLDAITFALYGGVSGSAADSGRLRSHHADPHVAPEVSLELSVRGERLRVTRTPEHRRPKRRGEGTTRERSSAHLERWDGRGWISRSHAQDEIGSLLGELLGLTREQFRQVVLLPQGEFATFLSADDDRRREVLVKLFGTEFFERVAQSLQQRAQQARAALTTAEAELKARFAAAWEASGEDPGAHLQRPVHSPQDEHRALEVVLAASVAAVEAAARALRAARRDEQTVRAVAAEAHDVAERARRRHQLLERLAEADAQRPAQAARLTRLADARRALPVRALLEDLGAARADAATCALQLEAAGLPCEPAAARERAALERVEAGAAQRLAAGLAHLLPLEAGLADDRRALAATREQARSARAQRDAVDRLAADVPLDLDRVSELVAATRAEAGSRDLLARELSEARQRLDAAREVASLTTHLEAVREQRRAARRAHDEARDHVDLILDQRLLGLTGELAGRLVSGDPCLVCGSTEHPAPAGGSGPSVTEQQVRAAVARRDEAWLMLESVDTALGGLQAQITARAALAGAATVEGLESRVRELEHRGAAAERAGAELAQLQGKLAELRETASDLTQRQLQWGERAAVAESDLARAESEFAVRALEVERGRGEHPSVAARCEWLEEQAQRRLAHAALLEQHVRAAEAAQRVEARVQAEGLRAGFPDVAAILAAATSEEEMLALEQETSRWQACVDAAQEQLATRELEAVAGVSAQAAEAVVSVTDELTTRHADAREQAQLRASIANRTLQRLSERMAEVDQAAGQCRALAAEHAEIAELDQYVRGLAGSPRMTLGTFVLRYWFEQVVCAANVRLQAMSSGKYELLRVDDGPRRDSRVGLGVAVLDRHTGSVRDTATLSGGESFYTSLSLALGLADVVTAQAGGAQLDTLFIDEGFGSLDPDTLDDVMAVIDDLRGHGRVVGIVSHVPELKERIAERLAIRRVRPDGPSQAEVIA